MLKIVVIDDEKIVLRGISALIQREAGFEFGGSADNGIDGLDLIRRERPDIVMTDIRMPGMTGLEMIRKAKEELPECVYIVFSGFNEFKYVKEAIGLGVIDYVEKPVTVPKLREVLKKASDMYQYRHNYSEMTKDLRKADRVYVEKALRDLYERPSEEGAILKQIFERNPKLEHAEAVFAAKLCERHADSVDAYRDLLNLFTFELIGEDAVEVYSFYEKENLVLVYFNLGKDAFPFSQRIRQQRQKVTENGMEVMVGISRIHQSVYDLCNVFSEADSALQYARYLDADDVVDIEEVEYQDPLPGELNQNHESLEFNFRLGKYEECRTQIRSYLEYLRGLSLMPELYIRKCSELVHLMQLMLNESDVGKTDYLDVNYRELIQLASEDEITEWTLQQTERILQQAGKDREDGSSLAVRKVKQYIEEHYAEGISLDDAAERVHMSKPYLSMLFKKEEGISYIKYLTRIRIERAMNFLKEGYKAKDVCEMVGYHDYKYFSSQFKSHTGMTLENYKKSL